jgi:16S rRNA C1402 N4-methylase RsmH
MAKKKEKNPISVEKHLPAYIEQETTETKKNVDNSPIIPEETELDKTDRNKKILLAALEKKSWRCHNCMPCG